MQPAGCVRPNKKLLDDAAPPYLLPGMGQDDIAHGLNVHQRRIIIVDAGQINAVMPDIQFAMVHAMSPYRMRVAKAAHVKMPACVAALPCPHTGCV